MAARLKAWLAPAPTIQLESFNARGLTPADPVCMHGAALDVHCCGCHDGFIFDNYHDCEATLRRREERERAEDDVEAQVEAMLYDDGVKGNQ
jgi:hypothetical protein